MTAPRAGWDDERVEAVIGRLLRAGVLAAAAVVLLGAALFLSRYGAAGVGERHPPAVLRTIPAIAAGVRAGDGGAIIQLGLLLLIATPVTRVLFALVGFTLQRDRTYMVISAIVLAALLFSLAGGAPGHPSPRP